MTRGLLLISGALLALAGCARPVPDDTGGGVGFGNYDVYQQGQVAAPPQSPLPAGSLPVSDETIIPPSAAQAEAAAPAPTDPITELVDQAIAEAESASSAPAPRDSSTISDEQSFDAVAARETIETDAERLERMAEQRVEIEPTDLPDRPGSTGPNIVEYALSTSHPVGQQVYRRSALGAARHEENCLSYQSSDLAQQAFLSMGGPERDRQRLDPDGDGYACSWDPTIYRNAARGG